MEWSNQKDEYLVKLAGISKPPNPRVVDWEKEVDRYKIIFDSVPTPALLLDLDNNIEDFNDKCLEYFPDPGFQEKISNGKKFPVSRVFPWLVSPLSDFQVGLSRELNLTQTVDCARGRIVFQLRIKKILDLFENHRSTLVVMNDITAIVEAEEKIKRARDFYLTLFEEFPAMIWRAGTDGQFNYFNKAWLAFTGRSFDQEKGQGLLQLLPEADRERFWQSYQFALQRQEPFQIEFRLKRADGQYRWMLCVGRPFQGLEGEFAGLIGSCYDITERKDHEEQLAYQAFHDPLTGLPNRRMLEVILPRLIEESEQGKPGALFFIDLDNFKLVNDTFGHHMGDSLLVELGHLIQKQLRSGDRLIRLGGDEFAVLLDGVQRKEAEAIALRLLESVSNYHFVTPQKSFNLFLSIGVAIISEKLDIEIIMSRADTAMYQAKERGGNQYVIYD
ncbi:MAG: sensor domain-containing diguanylate cyclase [Candidatus Saccharicenans sp.]|nr:sensor domain-containing diguanylate cyclase [Candidatus Saccharicenans sp.]MDI6848651.1 sensor domain-containing diguanylate cyclase [Candidatus Saccharicenans sp.]